MTIVTLTIFSLGVFCVAASLYMWRLEYKWKTKRYGVPYHRMPLDRGYSINGVVPRQTPADAEKEKK